MVIFISIAFALVKLKISKFWLLIQHPWNSPFWEVLGPWVIHKWSIFADILTIGSALASKNIGWNFFEGFKFLWRRNEPKISTFCPTLIPFFFLKMAEIQINNYWCEQTSWQNQGSISCPLSGKNIITFYTIWAIFGRKQDGVTIQSVRIKI